MHVYEAVETAECEAVETAEYVCAQHTQKLLMAGYISCISYL